MGLNHLLLPGQSVELESLPTRVEGLDRKESEVEFKTLRRQLRKLQVRLYAEGKQSLLILFQAMDAGGKDGSIRNVFQGVNPQGVGVTSFKQPSRNELAHDFLWRIHQATPGRGMIGVFNRSHYEDVLVVRVEKLVAESVWRQRYELINHFEELLAHQGTRLLKFYLHISPQEQLKRFRRRLVEADSKWKFSVEDLEKRRLWGDYMAAYQDALTRCSTEIAPWYAVPADQKWYRNLAISRVIVQTLLEMDPQYPNADVPEGFNIDDWD